MISKFICGVYMILKTEKELYSKLVELTKNKNIWNESIPFVASLLEEQTQKITGKSLWLLGEMGLLYPESVSPFVKNIAVYLSADDAFLRERALNALGRIGRAKYELIKPYWDSIFALSADDSPNVRLSFIWASENIATNTPEVYKDYIPTFEKLLDDENIRVRMEAPEMFRVLGKRKPEYVYQYLDKLKMLSENDIDRVVRIHAKGAIKTITAHYK